MLSALATTFSFHLFHIIDSLKNKLNKLMNVKDLDQIKILERESDREKDTHRERKGKDPIMQHLQMEKRIIVLFWMCAY